MSALAKDVLGSDETRTGGTGPWCWISTNAKNQLMWMLVTGKGFEIACYLITMSLYALLKIHLVRITVFKRGLLIQIMILHKLKARD